MHLARLVIQNFRNFEYIEIPLSSNVVLIGENRTGKSNLLFAIRLVLDQTLPESSRQLALSDFWDGCDLAQDPTIQVHLDFKDFDNSDALVALLTDFRTAQDPTIARLSYIYRKKPEISGPIQTSEDCEFIIYGGGEESRAVPSRIRRRIALDMLDALRDAEGQLGSWRHSPLRPLIGDALATVTRPELDAVANDLEAATQKVENFPAIQALEASLRAGILELAGNAHDVDAKLRFAPSDPQRLFRSIGMFIDGGKRSIAEASLGSANVTLIALKLAEFAWRRAKNERNYSLLCIEEPEAHLHPQLQRAVFDKLFRNANSAQALLVTSHSPTLAAVVPLRSIVNLRKVSGSTHAYSLAELPVTADELEDIERYLTATRSEILFSKGVIFVEGDAEEALLPSFALAQNVDLDMCGITVCNVAGANFVPYVKLAASLGLPWAVITDWDPHTNATAPLGHTRAIAIYDAWLQVTGRPPMSVETRQDLCAMDFTNFRNRFANLGVFLNNHTFEIAVANTPHLSKALFDILDEQGFGKLRTSRINAWRAGAPVDPGHILSMIADIGKGRLSAKLARRLPQLTAPDYITFAIHFVASRV